MNKEFCTYKQALALKELGFDEPCFGYYDKSMQVYDLLRFDKIVKKITNKNEWFILAPLYQQAFRWFREEHKISSSVIFNRDNGKYEYQCFSTISKSPYIVGGSFETYEEAESTCLDKLIEICKNK